MEIYILHDGQQTGPFSEETAREMLRQGAVLSSDLAWQTGMPEWLPLASILRSEHPEEVPAPETSSTESAVERQETSREERHLRFFEFCKTQGAEAIEGVTKAHCQVLVGYLDEKFPNWDAGDEKDAARKYFFPAVAEKFPQFVRPEWKGKLQYPASPKTASSPKARVPAKASSSPRRKAASPVGSFFKGFILGLLVVALAVGGLVAYKRPDLVEEAKAQWPVLLAKFSGKGKTTRSTAAETVSSTQEGNASSSETGNAAQDSPARTLEKSTATTSSKETLKEYPSGMTDTIPDPELPEPSSTPASASTALFDPSPSSAPAETAMTSSAAPKTSVKLLQPMEIESTYGKLQIPAGIQLPIVEQDGVNVKVRFQNQVVSIPANATDLGDSGLQQ